jgi:putative transposase
MKTYVFKLYRSKRNKYLDRKINLAGIIYNHLIALHRRDYQMFSKGIGVVRLQRHITKLRKIKHYAFVNNLQSIQDIAQRIDRAYKLFFQNLNRGVRTSPLGFKKVRKYRSFTPKQAGYKLLPGNRIKIMGKDDSKYSKSREIGSKIKTFTVKRDTLGYFWLYVVTDEEIKPLEARSAESVGLDFDLKTFLTTSLFMRQASDKIKKLSRKLSRRKKRSKNRSRARLDLARTHRRIAKQRRNFHYKTMLNFVHGYAFIFVEDLNMKAMQRIWWRKVADLEHAQFVNILS